MHSNMGLQHCHHRHWSNYARLHQRLLRRGRRLWNHISKESYKELCIYTVYIHIHLHTHIHLFLFTVNYIYICVCVYSCNLDILNVNLSIPDSLSASSFSFWLKRWTGTSAAKKFGTTEAAWQIVLKESAFLSFEMLRRCTLQSPEFPRNLTTSAMVSIIILESQSKATMLTIRPHQMHQAFDLPAH